MTLEAEKLICKKCGCIDDYTVEKSGRPHLKAICSCGAFLKFLTYTEPSLWFGKYSGTAVKSISDLSYLEWLIDNVVIKRGRIRRAIIDRISQLKEGVEA